MGEAKRIAAAMEREMSLLIGGDSCRSCHWRLKMHGALLCRRFPPTAVAIGVNNGKGVEFAWQASYPVVAPDYPCGEYKRDDAHAAEELRDAAKGATQQ